jgi:hypothetical protein
MPRELVRNRVHCVDAVAGNWASFLSELGSCFQEDGPQRSPFDRGPRAPSDPLQAVVYGYGLGRIWKIGHPTSVCHNDSSGVSEGPTR